MSFQDIRHASVNIVLDINVGQWLRYGKQLSREMIQMSLFWKVNLFDKNLIRGVEWKARGTKALPFGVVAPAIDVFFGFGSAISSTISGPGWTCSAAKNNSTWTTSLLPIVFHERLFVLWSSVHQWNWLGLTPYSSSRQNIHFLSQRLDLLENRGPFWNGQTQIEIKIEQLHPRRLTKSLGGLHSDSVVLVERMNKIDQQ